VARAQQPKVAPVQRGQLGLVEALDDGQDSRVHEANVGIGIAVAELSDPAVILRQHFLHKVGAFLNVVQEGNQDTRMQPSMDPVVQLDENRCGDDERLCGRLNEMATSAVIGIATIKRGVKWPGIQD